MAKLKGGFYMKNTIFENYVNLSDMDKGKVAPVEMITDDSVIRMLLDTKELLLSFGKEVTVTLVDIATGLVNDLGVLTDKNDIENIFNQIKETTFPTYHYSLDNLKNSL